VIKTRTLRASYRISALCTLNIALGCHHAIFDSGRRGALLHLHQLHPCGKGGACLAAAHGDAQQRRICRK
jgi:hypothetical protein